MHLNISDVFSTARRRNFQPRLAPVRSKAARPACLTDVQTRYSSFARAQHGCGGEVKETCIQASKQERKRERETERQRKRGDRRGESQRKRARESETIGGWEEHALQCASLSPSRHVAERTITCDVTAWSTSWRCVAWRGRRVASKRHVPARPRALTVMISDCAERKGGGGMAVWEVRQQERTVHAYTRKTEQCATRNDLTNSHRRHAWCFARCRAKS